jgi:poly-gamma-glutamate capsule biosynthesis protein CapA/YwtB (metallophosphatase superfamily)
MTTGAGRWPAPSSLAKMAGQTRRVQDQAGGTSPNGTVQLPPVTLFLAGDVMTGRGIDQVLPHPVEPHLFESYVHSARDYVALAEEVSGPIPGPVDFAYVWGDALAELERLRPDLRIVNLETAVTTSEAAWQWKGIHYRMHPANVPILSALRLDCCVLANNHVMDWDRDGLRETLATLSAAHIRTAGAGRDAAEAAAPAVLETSSHKRVLVFGFALRDSGVPPDWRATRHKPGVNLLHDLSGRSVDRVARDIDAHRRRGDVVIASVHWGPNWGFDIGVDERSFARNLLERAGVDLVHGHSSHHVKGIEVHREKLILYGCGDFLNDYEGIAGHGEYRGDLSLMYFPVLDAENGRLRQLLMMPTCTCRFRVNRATPEQIDWLYATLNREGRKLGTAVERHPGGGLRLGWR